MTRSFATTAALALVVAGEHLAEASIRGSYSAFVRNFTDEEVQVLKFMQAGFPLSARYNKPRTVGVSFTYSW